MRKANARPGGEFRWGCGYFKWGRGGGLRVSDYCSWQVAVRFPGDPPPHPEELVALSLPSPWSGGWRPWRSSDPKPLAYILPSV